MNLSKQDILKQHKIQVESVQVPEWQGEVFVRQMTAKQRDDFESSMLGNNKNRYKNIRGRLAAFCLCDENGQRLFDDKDAEQLGDLQASALDRLLPVIQRLNGMSNDDLEELKKTKAKMDQVSIKLKPAESEFIKNKCLSPTKIFKLKLKELGLK